MRGYVPMISPPPPPLDLNPLYPFLLSMSEDCPLSSRDGATYKDVSRFALTFFFTSTNKKASPQILEKKQTKQRRFVLPDEQTTITKKKQHTPKIFKTKP